MDSSSFPLREPSPLPKPSTVSSDGQTQRNNGWHYRYSTVTGFFLQDTAEVDQETVGIHWWHMKNNMGLIDQEYDTDRLLPDHGTSLTQWQRFANKLDIMNQNALEKDTYRLLYLGRHGQGFHNVAIMFYGDAAWDCYYGTFETDPHVPTVTYLDAHLTVLGRYQAHNASCRWQNLISIQKMPPPQTYYSSPLSRAMQTAQLTFSQLQLPKACPFRPVVKEALREGYGIQPCDFRQAKSYIQTNFPQFRIEDSFKEEDDNYPRSRREPLRHRFRRVRALLDDIFEHDESTYISMLSHNDTIEALLHTVGHEKISLPTCGTIPVLVKVSKVFGIHHEDEDNLSDNEEWEKRPECTIDLSKAGKQGFRDIGEFLEEINCGLPEMLSSPFQTATFRSDHV